MLVPVVDNPESQAAIEVACRLAAERGATISAVSVVEVPPLLPLDSHLGEQEEEARRLLERAGATGDSYGVKVVPHVLRGRDAGVAIVEEASAGEAELIVVGTARKTLRSTGALVFGGTVRHILSSAPCRVLVVAARPDADERSTAAGDARALARPAA